MSDLRRKQLIHGLGIVGLAKQSDYIIDLSFDILSLEALFLVPRYSSPSYFSHAQP
jgi:hypothetical protein